MVMGQLQMEGSRQSLGDLDPNFTNVRARGGGPAGEMTPGNDG